MINVSVSAVETMTQTDTS